MTPQVTYFDQVPSVDHPDTFMRFYYVKQTIELYLDLHLTMRATLINIGNLRLGLPGRSGLMTPYSDPLFGHGRARLGLNELAETTETQIAILQDVRTRLEKTLSAIVLATPKIGTSDTSHSYQTFIAITIATLCDEMEVESSHQYRIWADSPSIDIERDATYQRHTQYHYLAATIWNACQGNEIKA